MHKIATRGSLGLGLALVMALSAAPAGAQGKGAKAPAAKAPAAKGAKGGSAEAAKAAAAKKEATTLAAAATQAFNKGKFADAIEGFRKADQAFHSPSYLLMVGRAQAKSGHLLEAKATLEGITSEQLASYAPPDFFEAQSDAKKELTDVSARIPTLQITPASGVTGVALDGRALSDGELGKPIPLDPGEHTVTGKSANGEVKSTVRLAERATESLALSPAPVAPAPSAEASADVTSSPSATGTTTASASKGGVPAPPLPALVAFGVGGAGLIAGAVLGGLTLATKGDFDKALKNDNQELADKKALDGVLTRTLTDVSFGVAIVGAAVGGVFWLRAALNQPKPAAAGIVVAPYPGGVVVKGAF